MMWMCARIVILWAIFAKFFKIDNVSSVLYASALMLVLHFITWVFQRRQTTLEQEQQDEELPDMEITNAGKTVAKYLGKEYPLWLEVNGRDMFVYNGQSSYNTDVTFSVSATEFIIAPCISYILLNNSNQDFLAKQLGISVTELTCFDRNPQLVEA